MKLHKNISQVVEHIWDDHHSYSAGTRLRDDAFERSDDEKIKLIQEKVTDILEILGMDLTDDSLKGTPGRVAKMYVKEIFGGLKPDKMPKASTFSNN